MFTYTQRLSTFSSLSLPLSRNIEVTLLMPGQLRRPARTPAQVTPARPEIPPSPVASRMTPFLLGGLHSLPEVPQLLGGGGMLPRGEGARERLTTHSQVLNQPAPASHPW